MSRSRRRLPDVSFAILSCALAACASSAAPASEHDPAGTPADDEVPQVSFAADWTEYLSAPLASGGQVTVYYDIARLPQCRAEYMAQPAWDILVSWATDGGTAQSTSVTQLDGTTRTSMPVTLDIDAGHTLAMWFYNSDEAGCEAYDSAYGNNYQFPLSAPGANACAQAGGQCVATHGGTCNSGHWGLDGLGCAGAGDDSEGCCLP